VIGWRQRRELGPALAWVQLVAALVCIAALAYIVATASW